MYCLTVLCSAFTTFHVCFAGRPWQDLASISYLADLKSEKKVAYSVDGRKFALVSVDMYIHPYMHACMHACMHTYIHTYIHVETMKPSNQKWVQEFLQQ